MCTRTRTEAVEERRQLRHSDLDALDEISLRPVPLHCYRVHRRARRSASLLRVAAAAQHFCAAGFFVHTQESMIVFDVEIFVRPMPM